ncbi:MAG: toxin YoeB [Ignavibacteria bacterium RIFOXYA2_FULL_37_17]|nr:MAG: toxin YoeB [Stygiobacter sp. GWC2_38_9]OGU98034.1 MAG: toxin YoeB [Ignavibacteria bacterium RIFOXYA2_FULL_37_17]OGV07195.1 MAG: toxin YoeB [Stygiobacter sp. RIFOXYB2_FULL_37_11]OGV14579.1 MAG: toxin YoeB [Stygiobacter sp. RIFOXYC2_FULL_38_25]OGV29286.1 MAG: toxin YoeB [Stygiobacter sp. RIFOXYC12_FULL_38_8]OGV81459.1 MAG: toxin YoeB [Stygiobacter sp. GWF2_38_21]RJQ63509.1 MAG: Txe/YoeB family addiction module toxin [Stygiobacter sp.]
MRNVAFHERAFENFTNWASVNKNIFERLVYLIKETRKDPFTGVGKPELLKHELKGFWSRRINSEHRLVYKVTEESIIIISCKYHY